MFHAAALLASGFERFIDSRRAHIHRFVFGPAEQAGIEIESARSVSGVNFTNADDEHSVDHPPRRYEIETNRFERAARPFWLLSGAARVARAYSKKRDSRRLG